jgi:hypothetical protein
MNDIAGSRFENQLIRLKIPSCSGTINGAFRIQLPSRLIGGYIYDET